MGRPIVLIVDDDEAIRVLLEGIFNQWGYRTITACGARETLEILKKETPLAVISDVEMPEMNGLELLNEIKKRYPGIKVVMMSGNLLTKEEIQRSLELGASAFVPKPINLEKLRRIILTISPWPMQRG
ncbi:MAG: response regulator [Candidatus Latescibacteria bacterium]|nr:response regulator [Candidatus Latescibacterota bacterium]